MKEVLLWWKIQLYLDIKACLTQRLIMIEERVSRMKIYSQHYNLQILQYEFNEFDIAYDILMLILIH